MSPLTGLDQIAMKDRSDNDPVKVASFPGAAEMKRTFTRFAAVGYLLTACASPTLAHNGKPHTWHDLWRTWSFEPFVVIGLALSGWFFVRGLRQLWRESGRGHGIKGWEATAFAGGWLALFIALVSPLHSWGRVLFSAHMTQHEVRMLVAAPRLCSA